jgi:hypothetical protein
MAAAWCRPVAAHPEEAALDVAAVPDGQLGQEALDEFRSLLGRCRELAERILAPVLAEGRVRARAPDWIGADAGDAAEQIQESVTLKRPDGALELLIGIERALALQAVSVENPFRLLRLYQALEDLRSVGVVRFHFAGNAPTQQIAQGDFRRLDIPIAGLGLRARLRVD